MSEKNAVKVLPAAVRGSQIFNSVENLKKHKEIIWKYHDYARRCGKLAILYAARCGFELLAAKKAIPYGKFEKFKQDLGFPHGTAANYMNFAMEFEKRSDFQLVGNLKNLPSPSEAFNDEYIAITDSIQKLTSGKTLTQLYFDWGIKSTAQTLGGANQLHAFLREHYPDHPEYLKMSLRDLPKEVQKEWEKHPRAGAVPTSEESNRRIYQAIWRNLVSNLRQNGLTEKNYSYLMRNELEEVYGTLIDLKKEIMEALKK
jgi:hypothetical protein